MYYIISSIISIVINYNGNIIFKDYNNKEIKKNRKNLISQKVSDIFQIQLIDFNIQNGISSLEK